MIILDTCALIWLVDSPSNLSIKAREAIQRRPETLAVLPISAWEIAVKVRSGGLVMKHSISPLNWYQEALDDYGIHEIHINAKVLCTSADLTMIHRDTCDRMIIAAAIIHKAPVMTKDPTFAKYGIPVIW